MVCGPLPVIWILRAWPAVTDPGEVYVAVTVVQPTGMEFWLPEVEAIEVAPADREIV